MNDATEIWNYYLTLDSDLLNTYRYVEPENQEVVYSYEYGKLIMLSCSELETVFKMLCKHFEKKECGNMAQYKEIILKHIPEIVLADVGVVRYKQEIIPFKNWDNDRLFWWEEYVEIKHNLHTNITKANFKNAVYTLSALYIIILYYSKITNQLIDDYQSKCIYSDYSKKILVTTANNKLPGLK